MTSGRVRDESSKRRKEERKLFWRSSRKEDGHLVDHRGCCRRSVVLGL